MDIISEKLKSLPVSSGVYIMLDSDRRIIYVGKARILKNRVRQYFHSAANFTDKTAAMVSRIADFNYILTNSEADALALEANLIKKYKPQYNILLKDDKQYPYIKVNMKEEYPAFSITRKVKKDSAKYFGPYMGGIRARELLEIISGAFSLRLCAINVVKVSKNHRPCLNYHIGKCLAPCSGYIEGSKYREIVAKACDFLNGNDEEVKRILTEKMFAASENEQYEIAASMRDKLAMVEKLKEKKVAALPTNENIDVFSYHTDGKYGAVSILIIREGKMTGVKSFSVSDAGLDEGDTVASFISQYYDGNANAPRTVLTDADIDTVAMGEYLSNIFKRKIEAAVPVMGKKKKLTEMANANAKEYLYKYLEKIKHREELTEGAVSQLAEKLHLKKLPLKIECYDISHISGTDKAASMVVMINGEIQRSLYRRFRIKTVEGNDDFASLKEAVMRRLDKLFDGNNDESFSIAPDLIVIDGGLGQLHSAAEMLATRESDIELISLAKREEEIYTLNSNKPVVLAKSSLALRLMQRIRDEAHRFALSYHRKLREKRISSEISNIEGIGEVKMKALIAKFASLENIRSASLEALIEVEGISKKLAQNIIDYFKANESPDSERTLSENEIEKD